VEKAAAAVRRKRSNVRRSYKKRRKNWGPDSRRGRDRLRGNERKSESGSSDLDPMVHNGVMVILKAD
jgi:hypothetical protein